MNIDNITTWVFDLDNTLYNVDTDLFSKVSKRMTIFIQNEFHLNESDARDLQKKMFQKYGTTMRGLMVEHEMDPSEFLDFVHDIDVRDLKRDEQLRDLLIKLPGKRVIYTNGSVLHAERVTQQLGIYEVFEDIFDIVAGDFVPKPDPAPYKKMIREFDILPSQAVMVDDMAKNLRPASELGMKTVWLRHSKEWSSDALSVEHIDCEINELKTWLARIIK